MTAQPGRVPTPAEVPALAARASRRDLPAGDGLADVGGSGAHERTPQTQATDAAGRTGEHSPV